MKKAETCVMITCFRFFMHTGAPKELCHQTDFVPFTNQAQMLKMRLLSLNVHPYILTDMP